MRPGKTDWLALGDGWLIKQQLSNCGCCISDWRWRIDPKEGSVIGDCEGKILQTAKIGGGYAGTGLVADSLPFVLVLFPFEAQTFTRVLEG
jgi:hypothetical protein